MFNSLKSIRKLDISREKTLRENAKCIFATDDKIINKLITIKEERNYYRNLLFFLPTITVSTAVILSIYFMTITVSHIGIFTGNSTTTLLKVWYGILMFTSISLGITPFVRYFMKDHNPFLKDSEHEAFLRYGNMKNAPKGCFAVFMNNAKVHKFALYSFHPYSLCKPFHMIEKLNIILSAPKALQREFFKLMYGTLKEVIITTTIRVLLIISLGITSVLQTINYFLDSPSSLTYSWIVVIIIFVGHWTMYVITTHKNAKKYMFRRTSKRIAECAIRKKKADVLMVMINVKLQKRQAFVAQGKRIKKKNKKK